MFEDLRARCGGQAIPFRLRRRGVHERLFDGRAVGRLPFADATTAIGRIGHGNARRIRFRTRHQRRCAPRFDRGVDRVAEGFEFVVVRQIDAHGIFPGFAVQVDRLRDARMRFRFEAAHDFARIGDEVADRCVLIDDAIHERRVRAVFEQAAHEVRQQVFVAADRRIHAARDVQMFLADHFVVQIGAHAVQALELERPAFRVMMDRRDRVCVMRGELRIKQLAVIEQAARAGEITDIGIRLAREHRIVAVTIDLRALHFGIPVRTLDQARAPAPPGFLRLRGEPVDHEQRAFLICLHGEAEAIPAGQRWMCKNLRHDFQREFKPVGLFGIDRHADAALHRELREFDNLRREFGQHAGAFGHLIARMQRRELHRNARRINHTRIWAASADGVDRILVGLEITLGIGRGERCFAEHVERITIRTIVLVARARQRLFDGAAHHELVAHDAHRLAHREAHDWLAAARDQTF